MNNFFCYVPAFKQALVRLSFLYLCSGKTEEAQIMPRVVVLIKPKFVNKC